MLTLQYSSDCFLNDALFALTQNGSENVPASLPRELCRSLISPSALFSSINQQVLSTAFPFQKGRL